MYKKVLVCTHGRFGEELIKSVEETKIPQQTEEVRAPHLYEAIISFLGIVVVMSIGIVKYGVDPHIPMFVGVIIAALVSMKIGYKWADIEGMMIHGISMAMQAILILCIVGMMIGVCILSGTIPTMIYYGLKLLSPSIFLIAAVIICSITSLAEVVILSMLFLAERIVRATSTTAQTPKRTSTIKAMFR